MFTRLSDRIHPTRRDRQRGISLISMLAIIAVIGIILYFEGPKILQMFSGAASSNESSDIETLAKNIKAYYGTTPGSYAGLTVPVVVAANIAPANMVSGAALVDDYGGAITLAVVAIAGEQAFTITTPGVPAGDCAKIANNAIVNFYQVSVGGTVVTNQASVATACAAGGAAPVAIVYTQT